MSAITIRTMRTSASSKLAGLGNRLSAIRKAVAEIVTEIAAGLAPAPTLQPIPVRVRRRRD